MSAAPVAPFGATAVSRYLGSVKRPDSGKQDYCRDEQSLVERLRILHELHFDLAGAQTIDDLCYTLVERGPGAVGVDRFGLWFVDEEDPEWFDGSFGIDETGAIRDERQSRVRRDPKIYDDSFFERQVQYRLLQKHATFNDRHEVVGEGDLVIAPMWDGTRTIGALSADNQLSGRPLSEEDAQLIALTARMVGHLVTIKRTEQKLQAQATVDDLTGLLNRRAGMHMLEQQIALSSRRGEDLTVVFIDLDGLKRINDTRGHAAGDEFIRQVAAAIEASRRSSDLACRMGGDEFMLLLPDTSLSQAEELVNRLLEEAAHSATLRDIAAPPWFSYGLASLASLDGAAEDPEKAIQVLVQKADEGMYTQKRSHQRDRFE